VQEILRRARFWIMLLSNRLVDPSGKGHGEGARSLACHSRWPQVRSTEGEARNVSQGERLTVNSFSLSTAFYFSACRALHKQLPTH
jgi:hypothetical protein